MTKQGMVGMEGFFIIRGVFRMVMDWLTGTERSAATPIQHRQYDQEFKSPGNDISPGQFDSIMRGPGTDAIRAAGSPASIQGGETVSPTGTPVTPLGNPPTSNNSLRNR